LLRKVCQKYIENSTIIISTGERKKEEREISG
jgi:hypothetical protein